MPKILADPFLVLGDTPKRLAGPVAGTGAAATLYTVPALTTAILRAVHVVNTTAGALTFKMSIGVDAVGTRLFSDISVPKNGTLDWDGFMVLAAAETLRWNAPTGLTVSVSGMELT